MQDHTSAQTFMRNKYISFSAVDFSLQPYQGKNNKHFKVLQYVEFPQDFSQPNVS